MKYLIIFLLSILTSCAAPGTAFLGPAVTGATTESLGRASVSFASNQIVKKVQSASKRTNNEVTKIVNKLDKLINSRQNKDLLNLHK
jgi:hypothetical protein|tara:strand:+ start:304 stop:564 length:261 start_codon:yes stop_codon:yes gene_type:complete